MLNIIDEFTRECLAIRIDRELNSTDVIDALFIPRRVVMFVPTAARSSSLRPYGTGSPLSDRVHRTWQSMGERLLREL
jgi:hypothetical protein